MPDDPMSQEPLAEGAEADSNTSPQSSDSVLLEVFNPFEALEIFLDKDVGLFLLVVVVAAIPIILVALGLWSLVQEVFVGGGPPQSLGLK